MAERKVGGLSVFKGYESKTTADRIAYYRHRAVELQFVRFDGNWYLEITPSYHFTQDGMRLSRFFEQRLTGIKQFERQNKTHLRHLRLWEEVILQRHLTTRSSAKKQMNLFESQGTTRQVEPYTLIQFSSLLAFDVDWSVPEHAWLPRPNGESQSSTSDTRSLFDL